MVVVQLREMLQGEGLAERTVAEYVKWIRRLSRWCEMRDIDVSTIEAHQVREWIDATVPDSRESRKQAYTAVGHLSRLLGRDALNAGIRLPRKPRTVPDPFTDVEGFLDVEDRPLGRSPAHDSDVCVLRAVERDLPARGDLPGDQVVLERTRGLHAAHGH